MTKQVLSGVFDYKRTEISGTKVITFKVKPHFLVVVKLQIFRWFVPPKLQRKKDNAGN